MEHKIKVPYLFTERIIATPEFIEKNKLKLQNQDKIFQRYIEAKDAFLNFGTQVLMSHLPTHKILEFFNTETQERFKFGELTHTFVSDIQEICQDFLDYMNFAWDKSFNQKGISSSRSIQKLREWLWVMSREDLAELVDDDTLYNPYGAPALIAVCEKMGIPVPEELVEFSKEKIK